MAIIDPFPTIAQLAAETGEKWEGFSMAAEGTARAETKLKDALKTDSSKNRIPDANDALVLFVSFARHEMLEGSDYDWAVLVDGVASSSQAQQAQAISTALAQAKLIKPGRSGTFGVAISSHDLVHYIGGADDSNANFTRRILLLLESRYLELAPSSASKRIWENVIKSILKRYFEEDVHFRPGSHRVPRFLLNDITRYWRTVCVDYAAKHWQQGGQKWALRNAKIRLSRKLLYAAGLAFCFDCYLRHPVRAHGKMTSGAQPFIQYALQFTKTPPLEYLASFIKRNIANKRKRIQVARRVFGSYNQWLLLMNDKETRKALNKLSHSQAPKNLHFERIRDIGSTFAQGLRELFLTENTTMIQSLT